MEDPRRVEVLSHL